MKKKHMKIFLVFIVLVAILVITTFVTKYSSRASVMTTEEYVICDMDGDKDCDKTDYILANYSVGSCANEGNYYIRTADANHDLCVTEEDVAILFDNISKEDLRSSKIYKFLIESEIYLANLLTSLVLISMQE